MRLVLSGTIDGIGDEGFFLVVVVKDCICRANLLDFFFEGGGRGEEEEGVCSLVGKATIFF